MTSRLRLLVALFAVLTLLLAACGGDDGGDTGDTGDGGDGAAEGEDLGLEEDGVIRVGTDAAFEPFEFIEDGEYAGFDIDLMDEIAERLDLEVEYVNTSFDTIFTQLSAGEFDAIISAITITEERQQTIAFTEPYFAANQAIVAPTDTEISSEDDLGGLDVGVQAATTGFEYASENFTDSRIVEFPTSEAAFTALRSGQLDAVFIDLPVAAANAEGADDIDLVTEVNTDELYGIGLQQDNTALADAINEQLQAIIDDGTYDEIYSTWFEGDPPEQFRGGDSEGS